MVEIAEEKNVKIRFVFKNGNELNATITQGNFNNICNSLNDETATFHIIHVDKSFKETGLTYIIQKNLLYIQRW